MAKITLDPIVGSYASVTALNARFQQIEDEFNSDVLYRNNPTGETNTMSNDLDMNGYSILNASDFSADDLYLGKYATAPTTDKLGATLGASQIGYIYYNTTSKDMWVWNGTAWGLIGTTQNSAASVTIADAGGHYAATNVEAALQELGSTATGEGASIIGIEDAGGYLTATEVEGALQEVAAQARKGSVNKSFTAASDAITFDSLPSWVTKITLAINGISTSGTPTDIFVRVGSGGTPQTTAYSSAGSSINGATSASASATAGYLLVDTVDNATGYYGDVVLHKMAADEWICRGQVGDTLARMHWVTGWKNVAATLDVVELKVVGTGVAFDFGEVTLTYE